MSASYYATTGLGMEIIHPELIEEFNPQYPGDFEAFLSDEYEGAVVSAVSNTYYEEDSKRFVLAKKSSTSLVIGEEDAQILDTDTVIGMITDAEANAILGKLSERWPGAFGGKDWIIAPCVSI